MFKKLFIFQIKYQNVGGDNNISSSQAKKKWSATKKIATKIVGITCNRLEKNDGNLSLRKSFAKDEQKLITKAHSAKTCARRKACKM